MFKSIFNRLLPMSIAALVFFFSSCESEDNDKRPQVINTGQTKIGDYSLYNRTINGNKSGNIVLLTGLAGTTTDWESIERKIADYGLVLNYDREGIGKSAWQRRSKDSRTIASELHNLLQAKKIKPPYVLVAHSMGGIHARVFASMYPGEVSGIVLVDPTPENLIDRLLSALPATERDFILEQIRLQDEEALKQIPEGGIKEEFKAIEKSYEQVRTAIWKTNVPIAVISSMKLEENDTPQSKETAKQLRDEMLLNTGTTKKEHYTTKAGHFVQKEEPELVLKAIKWVKSN